MFLTKAPSERQNGRSRENELFPQFKGLLDRRGAFILSLVALIHNTVTFSCGVIFNGVSRAALAFKGLRQNADHSFGGAIDEFN